MRRKVLQWKQGRMNAAIDTLTPAEAAVVAGVSVLDVHRVIDEQILPESFYDIRGGRSFRIQACVFIAFYFGAGDRILVGRESFTFFSVFWTTINLVKTLTLFMVREAIWQWRRWPRLYPTRLWTLPTLKQLTWQGATTGAALQQFGGSGWLNTKTSLNNLWIVRVFRVKPDG
jgi:hypothetical protein